MRSQNYLKYLKHFTLELLCFSCNSLLSDWKQSHKRKSLRNFNELSERCCEVHLSIFQCQLNATYLLDQGLSVQGNFVKLYPQLLLAASIETNRKSSCSNLWVNRENPIRRVGIGWIPRIPFSFMNLFYTESAECNKFLMKFVKFHSNQKLWIDKVGFYAWQVMWLKFN